MTSATGITAVETKRLFVDDLAVVTTDDFEKSQSLARKLHIPIEQAIAERGRVPMQFIMEQVAASWGLQFTALKTSAINPVIMRMIPLNVARAANAVAFGFDAGRLSVALVDPRNQRTLDELRRVTGKEIVPFLAEATAVQRAHLLYRQEIRDLMRREADRTAVETSGTADATSLMTRVLDFAAVSGASDIHIEPYADELLIRCRIDGVLQDVLTLPPPAGGPLTTRIKVLAGMRIDEKRIPQDGRFDHDAGGVPLDLRVSSLPTHFGEKLVLRVITRDTRTFDLEALGMRDDDYAQVSACLARPHGLVLVTGPTGSGKSTTLYSMVTRLTAERQSLVNISTIEDPVEHELPRVAQVSVNELAGIDFAGGLRALLRQDPDIIMVGEIRDRETAEIAVRAALVGRLVLSTLHTNDTPTTIPRLIDMGVEPFLLSSTLSMVVAQRLVRRICDNCRERVPVDDDVRAMLETRPDWSTLLGHLRERGTIRSDAEELSDLRLFHGRGCAQCGGSGFRGRTGVFEILRVNDEMRHAIISRPGAATIAALAADAGYRTMFEDGLTKVILGETTLREVLRVAA